MDRRKFLKGAAVASVAAMFPSLTPAEPKAERLHFPQPIHRKEAVSGLQGIVENTISELRAAKRIAPEERAAALVYAINNDETLVSINADESMQSASMAKPTMALGAMTAIDNWSKDSFFLENLRWALLESYNFSANYLMYRIGGPLELQRVLETRYKNIFHQIRIDYFQFAKRDKDKYPHVRLEREIDIPEGKSFYGNIMTPNDHSRFLAEMWRNRKDPMWKKIMSYLSLEMKRESFAARTRIADTSSGFPASAAAYLKTGTTQRVCGEIGLVVYQGPFGKIPVNIVIIVDREKRVRDEDYETWARSMSGVISLISSTMHKYISGIYAFQPALKENL